MAEMHFYVETEVKATEIWKKTGVYISGNGVATVAYKSGKWSVSPAVSNVDGNGSSSYIAKDGYALPGKPEGCLVGRISGRTFYIGNKGETPQGASGELELCTNDDVDGRYGSGYSDNSGSIIVTISERNA